MKQHPILFSTPMVQAILSGAKTQTRRIVKPKYLERGSTPFHTIKKSPYGLKGDQLWVRETFVWEGDTGWQDMCPVGSFFYKADFEDGDGPTKWKPSIFMPLRACRIFLEITEVRVERVRDISYEDAKDEGVEPCDFRELWGKINGAASWLSNPWVWVITFQKM